MSSTTLFHLLSSEAVSSRLGSLPEDSVPLCDLFGWRAGAGSVPDPEAFLRTRPAPRLAVVASTPEQARIADAYAAYVYLPGEICRQGDVIEAVEHATLILERGAFLPPPDMVRALAKAKAPQVWAVDAGSSFGYSDRVLDPRAIALLRRNGVKVGLHVPLLVAPQEPTWRWRSSWTASADFIEPLVRTASALEASFFVVDDACCEKVREVLS